MLHKTVKLALEQYSIGNVRADVLALKLGKCILRLLSYKAFDLPWFMQWRISFANFHSSSNGVCNIRRSLSTSFCCCYNHVSVIIFFFTNLKISNCV